MSDLKFICRECGQHLEAPEDMLGETVACPKCNRSIQLPKCQQERCPQESTYNSCVSVALNKVAQPVSSKKEIIAKPIDATSIAKRVSIWIAVYGWVMLTYWLIDTLIFFNSLPNDGSLIYVYWGYASIRGAIGLSLIVLASKTRGNTSRAVRYLGFVLVLLFFRLFMMMCIDNEFFSFHPTDLLGRGISPPAPRHGMYGGGPLIALIGYLWKKRRALKRIPIVNQEEQPKSAENTPPVSSDKQGCFARNRLPIVVTLGLIVVSAIFMVCFSPSLEKRLVGNWRRGSTDVVLQSGTMAFRNTGRVYGSYQVLDNETLLYRTGTKEWIVKVKFPTATTMIWYRGKTDELREWMTFQRVREADATPVLTDADMADATPVSHNIDPQTLVKDMWCRVATVIPSSVYGKFQSNPKWDGWCKLSNDGRFYNATLYNDAVAHYDHETIIKLLTDFMRYAEIQMPTNR